jgi:MFS family permease
VITAEANRQPRGAFGALTSRSYRIYIAGQSLANTGAWMQSVAQDWLIFDLTHSSAAVGVTMALQFLPLLLLSLTAGAMADRLPKRRILLTTQTLNAAATAALAFITLSGTVKATDVYAFALVSGVIFAFDAPTRQVFVAEVVPPRQLRAGIALNAAVFQATRLIGPAVASLLIVSAGTGWVFAVNAACYLGPTAGLLRLRPADLTPVPHAPREPHALLTAARHLRERPDVLAAIFLVGMLGTFGLNFPIVLTAMAKTAFGGTASMYGLFNIVLAAGSCAGALLGGAGRYPGMRVLAATAAGFGIAQAVAALAPNLPSFLVLIAVMGFVNLVFQAKANAYVQLAVAPELRGRVMGLYMLVFLGGTPIGAPVIGALTGQLGARAGMAICGIVPALAALVMATAVAVTSRRRHGPAALTPAPDVLLPGSPAPGSRSPEPVAPGPLPLGSLPSGRGSGHGARTTAGQADTLVFESSE